ncbi:MAG: ankyrin repeat domain-containing protein [Bacteroidales bacterium]|nr:ankyrin repeat domain-containing protein [Bacteroidales bacterium]
MRFLTLLVFIVLARISLAQEPSAKEFSLIQACETGKVEQVLLLLNEGISSNCTNLDGMTPLHYAVQNGHIRIVKILLLNGTKIDIIDIDKRTPLLLAVHFNQLDIAEYLVQQGANVNIPDYAGLTPLFYAAAYGDYFMTDMFLFYKGNQDIKDYSGKTPFMAALWGGFPLAAKTLLDYGAEIDAQDKEGQTALMLSILNNDSISTDSLIHWKASLEIENNKHLTALEIALSTNNQHAIKSLITAGANVNHIIQDGFNTMDFAISSGVKSETKSIISEAGALHHKAPSLKNFSLGLSSMFGSEDSRLGVRAEWFDSRYKFGIQTGLSQRPGRLKVYYPLNDSVSFLFRETRTSLSISLFKLFPLISFQEGKHTGIILSGNLEASMGGFKATSTKPKFQIFGFPTVSLYYANPNIRYELGYQYNPAVNYLWTPSAILFSITLAIKKQFK